MCQVLFLLQNGLVSSWFTGRFLMIDPREQKVYPWILQQTVAKVHLEENLKHTCGKVYKFRMQQKCQHLMTFLQGRWWQGGIIITPLYLTGSWENIAFQEGVLDWESQLPAMPLHFQRNRTLSKGKPLQLERKPFRRRRKPIGEKEDILKGLFSEMEDGIEVVQSISRDHS